MFCADPPVHHRLAQLRELVCVVEMDREQRFLFDLNGVSAATAATHCCPPDPCPLPPAPCCPCSFACGPPHSLGVGVVPVVVLPPPYC
eukprot:COSAG04_NODE_984_length_9007_cov_4.572631_5_plen_88_part_00